MRLGTFLDSCISNHKNGTEPNSTLCSDCKEDYLNLTNYYNEYKVYNGFCMDIVDLVNFESSAKIIIDLFLIAKCL